MTLINGKVVLLIGGALLITEAVVRHFLEKGATQVRAYSGDEDGLTALRDRLQEVDATAAARVKYYVGDVVEPSIWTRRWPEWTTCFSPRPSSLNASVMRIPPMPALRCLAPSIL